MSDSSADNSSWQTSVVNRIFSGSGLQPSQDVLEQGREDSVLPLGRQVWGVLDAHDEVTPVDPGFARLHL